MASLKKGGLYFISMDCLTNYIGLNNCNQPIPESGLYINDLPGMSTELVDNIADSEEINFNGVWAKVQKRSFLRLKNDIQIGLKKWVKLNQIIYQTRKLLKSQTDSYITVPANTNYTGIYLMLPESRYVEFRFNDIVVFSKQTVTTTLKAWDLNDGEEIYSQSIDLVPGLNTIPVKQVFPLKYRIIEMFVGVDTSGFDSMETLNDYYYWYTNDWACAAQSTFGYGSIRGVFQFYPATFDSNLPVKLSNVIRTGIGKGITINGEIRCSIDQFICDNRELLGQPLLYLLGSEMLKEKKNSPRLNYFTASNLAQTEETYQDFEKMYKENLDDVLDAIPLQGESICFDCEDAFLVTTKNMMP